MYNLCGKQQICNDIEITPVEMCVICHNDHRITIRTIYVYIIHYIKHIVVICSYLKMERLCNIMGWYMNCITKTPSNQMDLFHDLACNIHSIYYVGYRIYGM